MNITQPSSKGFSVTIKLQILVFAIILLIIGVQTWLSISNAKQRNEIETKQDLAALYNAFNEEIKILEKTAASLSLSLAHRPDIQERFQAKDRQEMLALLKPVFTTLKTDYDIVHLQFHEPSGHIFLRIHDPEKYGDYTFTYRQANALAIISRQTVTGVEIDPNRMGILGVSPLFHQGQFVGLVEVGLDYDQAFLENFKARHGADYKMWILHKDAAPAGLGPVASDPGSPAPEFFYYAATNTTALSIPLEVYDAVLQEGEPQVQFISDGKQELAVLIAPILSYGDRIIGILEISISRAEALADLQRNQRTTLSVAAGLALLAFVLMWISTNLVVLRPLGHLTAVAQRQLKGDLTARVELLPADEFGQLGHTFNILTETLDNTLKDQDVIIAERTAQLQQELTERKRAEEALQKANDELEMRVEKRTVELVTANEVLHVEIAERKRTKEALAAKNQELENYLYVASHDLRSPLINIQGFSQRLQKQINLLTEVLAEYPFETEAKQQVEKITNKTIPKALGFIFTSVAKMDALINGLLQISRTGQSKMTIQKIDMNTIVENVIRAFNFQIEAATVKVVVENLPACYGDAKLLNQLFSNMIDNALKYRAKNRPLMITISAQTGYNKVIYSLEDTGLGMAPRHLEKIWGVFYRVDTQSSAVGEGLGLSIVKTIIDKHQGKIRVESEADRGSTFYIELPIHKFSE